MKKVLKNVLNWLICVCLTFTVIFTISHLEDIIASYSGIGFMINDAGYEEVFGKEVLEDAVKWHEEITVRQFQADEANQDDIMVKLYTQYPVGVTRTMYMIADYISYVNITSISLILGLIIGTAIYMLLDIEKNGLKIVVLIYILSVVLLGFVQGFLNIYGEGLTLLDKWMFPDEYILPVSIAFALVVIVKFIKQKDIAKKLNEKLKERKEEKNK